MTEFKLKDYMNRITIFQSAVSKNGTKIAYISNLTGSPQVWVGALDPKVDQVLFPKPVTHDKENLPHIFSKAIQWIGDDKLLLLYDHHGNENTKIKLLDFKTGEEIFVPAGDKGRDFFQFVSEDGQTIYLTSSRDDEQTHALYTFNIKKRELKKIYGSKGFWTSWASAKPYKKDQFLIQQTISNTETHLKLLNIKTGKTTDLIKHKSVSTDVIDILPKDKLLITTNKDRQFNSLATFDMKTEEITYLDKDMWDVELVTLTPDQKQLFVVQNVKGQSHLKSYSFPSYKPQKINFKKQGVISSLKYLKSPNALFISYWSPTEPTNIYRLQLKTKKTDQLTDTWTSRIPQKNLCLPQLVRFKSQGKDIHSLFFLPKNAKKNKKTPVVIWPHGGPQWQERPQFRPIFQYLLSKGLAIWAPNPHGSTGYGVDFTNSINQRWGDADLPDMKNGIEYLKTSGWIDPQRIAIMGGSYGGYMTLRSITKLSKTFKVAVDIFGVSNLVSFVNSVPEDWKPAMDSLVGNPVKDLKRLQEQSPVNALGNIDCPLLIIQGAKDPRVVKAESDQVVEKMKKLKKQVEYLVFEDEGHGFFKTENEIKAYETAAAFIEKHL